MMRLALVLLTLAQVGWRAGEPMADRSSAPMGNEGTVGFTAKSAAAGSTDSGMAVHNKPRSAIRTNPDK